MSKEKYAHLHTQVSLIFTIYARLLGPHKYRNIIPFSYGMVYTYLCARIPQQIQLVSCHRRCLTITIKCKVFPKNINRFYRNAALNE